MKPLDPSVAALVCRLDAGLHELWQERAAIREHDGGQSRELAEAMAIVDLIQIDAAAAMASWT